LVRRRIRLAQKADGSAIAFVCDGADCWRVCVNILDPKPIGIDLYNFDLKMLTCCGKYLDVGGFDRRLAFQRVCKFKHSTSRHLRPPNKNPSGYMWGKSGDELLSHSSILVEAFRRDHAITTPDGCRARDIRPIPPAGSDAIPHYQLKSRRGSRSSFDLNQWLPADRRAYPRHACKCQHVLAPLTPKLSVTTIYQVSGLSSL
jgi:hypothetical protein